MACILGINDGVSAGAALIVGGRIAAAVNEERIVRKKMAIGFPANSIDEVLRLAGRTPRDVDAIAVATHDEHFRTPAIAYEGWFQTNVTPIKKLQYSSASLVARWGGGSAPMHKLYYLSRLPASHARKRAINALLRVRWGFQAPVHWVDHHTAHAASAYYTSGFEDAAVISVDGGGDGKSSRVFAGRGRTLTELASVDAYHSIGNFYAYVTKICGFRAHKHEGKITGLAAYGKPVYLDALRGMLRYEDGRYVNVSRSYYWSAVRAIERILPPGWKKEDLAASVQALLEEIGVAYIKHWVKKIGLPDLAVAGGIFANVRLNQHLRELDGVRDLYVFPAMGDEGLAVGAAYQVLAERRDADVTAGEPYRPMSMYFGTGYSDAEMEQALRDTGIHYEEADDVEERTAALLAEGWVVARFSGKMEYGPRALGNRSILYQPTDPTVNDWLNRRLKRTEFMPFAPITMSEYASLCFRNVDPPPRAARFMTLTVDCTDWMKRHCPAVVHLDGTARPQLVDKDLDPGMHRLLEAYRRRTGLPTVINTSFNMHEEPIVRSPQDALRAFLQGHLDYLAMGRFIVPHPERILRPVASAGVAAASAVEAGGAIPAAFEPVLEKEDSFSGLAR